MTECCCYCCTAVKSTTVVRIPERCVLSVLLLVSRPEPAPADCSLATEGRAARASGAKQRRYAAVSPSNFSIVLLLFAVVDNILNLESMLCFELKNLMTQVVGFWARIRRLGLWDSQIEKNPVGFCIFGLHYYRGHSFLRSKNANLKLEIEPHRKQPERYVPYISRCEPEFLGW